MLEAQKAKINGMLISRDDGERRLFLGYTVDPSGYGDSYSADSAEGYSVNLYY